MKTLPKALVGTVAAAAVAVSSASPAVARDHRGGIDGGDIIAGALVIGGIAAIAAAASKDNNRYDYDRYGYGDDWPNRDWRGRDGWNDGRYRDGYYGRGNPRQAIEQCVRTAERTASRYSYGRADVTDIRDVKNTRWGYEVRGRIAVNTQGRDWRDGDRNYGRGWGGDYRGWDNSLRGYDSGSFKCKVERGRVVDIDYSGIRGL